MLKHLVAISLALGSSAAVAADLGVMKAPPLAPVYAVNWTGFYIGGEVGYVWGRADSIAIPTGVTFRGQPRGVIGGVFAGYDYQLPNNFVVGARVAAPVFTSARDTLEDAFNPGLFYRAEVRWAVLGTLQLGYAMGNWMPYIGGGIGVGEGRGTVTGNLFPGDATNTHVGYVFNAGLKVLMTPNWFAGVHYTHTGWSKEDYTFQAAAFTTTTAFSTDSVMAQLGYKF
jgi:opacity protein-like surface antigen